MTREEALMLAAQAWCKPKTSGKEVDANLAEVFADIILYVLSERDKETCEWSENNPCFPLYVSGCGEATPTRYKYKFCPFCGKKIIMKGVVE